MKVGILLHKILNWGRGVYIGTLTPVICSCGVGLRGVTMSLSPQGRAKTSLTRAFKIEK